MPPARSSEPPLIFGRPVIGEDEIAEVVDCLRSGWIGRGPRVARFEQAFAAYKGVPDAVAVRSCTSAMLLSLQAAGVGPGDEVVTTALTFCATINAIIRAGARPVLADIDPATSTIDPRRVLDRVTGRTRALIPVHFAGRPCEMDELMEVARSRGLTVIEDCAHAIEAEYHGRAVGTIGDFGCFSFSASKSVTTGDGGMVLAQDRTRLAAIRTMSSQGMSADAWRRFEEGGRSEYAVVAGGFKECMTDIEAALGIRQLAHVDERWRARERLWLECRAALSDLPVTLPAPPAPGSRHGYHLFTIGVDPSVAGTTRDDLIHALAQRNIAAAVHYRSVAEEPYYQGRFGWRPEDFPEAVRTGRQTVTLPLSPVYTGLEMDRILTAVRAALCPSAGRIASAS